MSSVVKLGERVQQEKDLQQAGKVASSLERRWHLLFLRALEWQCHIEALAARCNRSAKVSFILLFFFLFLPAPVVIFFHFNPHEKDKSKLDTKKILQISVYFILNFRLLATN